VTAPRIAEIQHAVADEFCIPVMEMKSERRAREVSRPRQVAMYLSKRLTAKSMPQIGGAFLRDHTTVMHAVRVVESLMFADPEMRDRIAAIIERLDPAPPRTKPGQWAAGYQAGYSAGLQEKLSRIFR